MAQSKIGLYQIESGDGTNESLEEKLLNIIQETGLDADGTYTPDGTTNYITTATDLKDADKKLDAELKAANDRAIVKDGSVAFTGNQSMGGNKLTNVGAPVAGTDAVNKEYADALAQGIKWKNPVRVTSTANIDLATGGLLTIDGITLIAGERVLVKDQTDATENGIYVVDAGAWTRASDADTGAEIPQMAVFVQEGTVNADMAFVLTTDGTITLGTTSLTYVQFTGLGQITAGAGLTKTGNTLDVGAGDGVQVDVDSITVKIDGDTLSKSGSGLKVKYQDSDTIDLSDDASGLKADLRFQDSNSIDLSVDASGLKADVKTQSGNATTISIDASGLKVDLNLDTDLTSVSASDDTVASAKATKAYIDAAIALSNQKIIVAASLPVTAPKFDLVKNYTAVATANNVAVTIPGGASYLMGKGNIMVFKNGVYLIPGAGDYTETSTAVITVAKLKSGDMVTFVIGKQAILDYTTAFAYDGSNRINLVTFTGDIDRTIGYTYNVDNSVNTEVTTEQGKVITRTYAYSGGNITGITTAIV